MNIHIPKQLLPSKGSARYEVRFRSLKPPTPNSTIHLCLLDHDQNAVLYQLLYEDTKEVYTMFGPKMNLQGIYLAPGQDTWGLEEVTIQHENIITSFPYYGTLGGRSKESAVYLPVSYKPNVDMKPIYDAEYLLLKEKVLQYTVELTLGGSLLTAFLSTMEKGYSFGVGGCIGYLYISLLEMSVDRVGKSSLVFTEQIARLGCISIIAISLLQKYQADISQDNLYFLTGVLGFMMHRVALILSYVRK